MRQLKFPNYEYLKALPKTEYYEKWDEDIPKEYSFTLFEIPSLNIWGRFSYNEDGEDWIYFDVMEGGFSDQNWIGKAYSFNKENYAKICKYAQEVFEGLYVELDKDCSHLWNIEGEMIND